MQNILDIGQIVLAFAGGLLHPPADPGYRNQHHRHKQQEDQGQLLAFRNHHVDGKYQREKLEQELGHHRGKRYLDFVNVVDNGRNQRPRGVPREKARRAVENVLVELVAEIGDQPEAHVIHQVRSQIVADAFHHRGANQRHHNHGKHIVEMTWDELLQIDDVT